MDRTLALEINTLVERGCLAIPTTVLPPPIYSTIEHTNEDGSSIKSVDLDLSAVNAKKTNKNTNLDFPEIWPEIPVLSTNKSPHLENA